MRTARLKMNGAYFHVMNRCALQEFLFDDEEKEMFVKMMRRAEFFSGIKIMDYCVMNNHFHILLKVPEREDVPEALIKERVTVLYGEDRARKMFARWDAFRAAGQAEVVEGELSALERRMYDLSQFMKTLDQRYSVWYRANHDMKEGTIWQGRFYSVLLDSDSGALSAVSSYISMNPVRAKIVVNPEDYPWCGIGAAKRKDMQACKGLAQIYGKTKDGDLVEQMKQNIDLQNMAAKKEEPQVDATTASAPQSFEKGALLLRRMKVLSHARVMGSQRFIASHLGVPQPGVGESLAGAINTGLSLGEGKLKLYALSRLRSV